MTQRAFSLIELLVVVAIIALLVAILVAAAAQSRQRGQAVKCEANMRSIAIASYMYAERYGGGFPRWGFGHGEIGGHTTESWVRTVGSDFAEERRALHCPIDRSTIWPRDAAQEREALAQEAQDIPLTYRRTSYASNYYMHAPGADHTKAGQRVGHPFNRIDWVTRPATTIQYIELAESGEYAVADHFHPERWEESHPQESEKVREQIVPERHFGAANYAMVDGHAERLRFEKTYSIDDGSSKDGEHVWFCNKYDPSIAK